MTESFELVLRQDGPELTTATIAYETTNFRNHPELIKLGINEEDSARFLAMYDPETGKTWVDERAPQWYRRMAALHEVICCGERLEGLIPNLPPKGDPRHCREVEKFVIRTAGYNQMEYIIYRRRMFNFLLTNNLNPDRDMLECTLDMLNHAKYY